MEPINSRSIAAKKRAAQQKELNPNHFSDLGKKNAGKIGIVKGFAYLKQHNPELHKELSRKGANKKNQPILD